MKGTNSNWVVSCSVASALALATACTFESPGTGVTVSDMTESDGGSEASSDGSGSSETTPTTSPTEPTTSPTTTGPTEPTTSPTTTGPTSATEPTTSGSTSDSDSESGCDNNTWYEDEDRDGHGDPGKVTIACEPPPGHVDKGDDCDDTNPTVNPNANEICDGLDNDCNTLVDEWSDLNEACSDCQLGTFDGHFYWFCPQNIKWPQALQGCDDRGATLAVVTSEGENSYIFTKVQPINEFDDSWWLGANDIEQEDNWIWVDGQKVADTYQNWDDGEPNNNFFDENCMVMIGLGLWNDVDCDNNQPFVCEAAP